MRFWYFVTMADEQVHGLAGVDAAPRLEPDLQLEIPALVTDVDLQGHRDALALRTRRASHSETTRATSEMAMDTAVSRSAGASPPGTCV